MVHNVEMKLSAWERAVVAKRVAVVAVITIVVNLLVAHGIITPDVNHNVLGWLNAGFDTLAGIAAVAWVQPAVTPSADPRTDDGEALKPVSYIKAAVEHSTPATNPQGGGMSAGAAEASNEVAAAQSDAGAPAPVVAPAVPSVP